MQNSKEGNNFPLRKRNKRKRMPKEPEYESEEVEDSSTSGQARKKVHWKGGVEVTDDSMELEEEDTEAGTANPDKVLHKGFDQSSERVLLP